MALLSLFFVSFIALMIFVFFNTQLATVTQAGNQEVSTTDSLLFAWPLELPADGETVSDITVFVRTADGLGIENSPVQIGTSLGTILNPSAVTDESGEATFQIVSAQPGIAEIQVTAGGLLLQRTITIQFLPPEDSRL